MNTTCPYCGNRKDRRAVACVSCRNKFRNTPEKKCSRCGRVFPRDQFGTRPNGSGGRKSVAQCKECRSLTDKEYRASWSPERLARSKMLAKAHDIAHREHHKRYLRIRAIKAWSDNPLVVESFVSKHNGYCDICGRHHSEAGTLQVDHCHSRNQFRGMLCSKCNTGIGQLKDDPAIMLAAAEYVSRPLPDLSGITVDPDEQRTMEIRNVFPGAKLTTSHVAEIRKRLASGEQALSIAEDYQISRSAIYAIKHGVSWRKTSVDTRPETDTTEPNEGLGTSC